MRFKGTPLQLTPGDVGGTASSLLCIFKDGADIGQKEEVTRLREQNTSEGDVLQVRVAYAFPKATMICTRAGMC